MTLGFRDILCHTSMEYVKCSGHVVEASLSETVEKLCGVVLSGDWERI